MTMMIPFKIQKIYSLFALSMITLLTIYSSNLELNSMSPPVGSQIITSLRHHNQSIAILGLVRDSEETLPHILDQLDVISCAFDNVLYILYESNSIDSTPSILADWLHDDDQCNDTKIEKIVLKTLPLDRDSNEHGLDRVERYAKYRNYLLQELRDHSMSMINAPDFMMMVDLDIFEFDAMATLREMDYALNTAGYSVMCGHGVSSSAAFYYDVFATVFSSGEWARFTHFEIPMERRHLDHLVTAHRFLDVKSCFNGISIYKYEVVMDTECQYVESESELRRDYPHFIDSFLIPFRQIKGQNAMICEHIPFHDCLSKRGHNVQIAISRDSFVYYDMESLHRN